MRGAAKRKKRKRKKRKRKKEKGRKREEENMEEACIITVKQMEHLSCGALCTHKLASWRPCPFWHKRVVRIYVLLHKALKCIGSYSNPFWRPCYAKARILTLVTVNYRFGAFLHFGALMQEKHVLPNILGHMPYASSVCQAAGTSIIGGALS